MAAGEDSAHGHVQHLSAAQALSCITGRGFGEPPHAQPKSKFHKATAAARRNLESKTRTLADSQSPQDTSTPNLQRRMPALSTSSLPSKLQLFQQYFYRIPRCIANRTVCIADSVATYRTDRTGPYRRISQHPTTSYTSTPPATTPNRRLQPPTSSHLPPATCLQPPGGGGWRRVAGGRWLELDGWSCGWRWWLEGGGRRMVVWLAWLVGWYGWSGGYSVWRIATEPNRNSAILAIHMPLNTAYVSVSTEPPDYNPMMNAIAVKAPKAPFNEP